MTKSYWKTDTAPARRERVERPSGGQVLRQLGIAVLVVALWSIIFAGYLYVTSEGEPTAVAEAPTGTPTAPHTDAPTPTMQRATATLSPVPTATLENGTITAEPSLTPAGAPTDTPPPTDTAAPPTQTATAVPTVTEMPVPPTATLAYTESDQVSFVNVVLPILQNRCVKCHGGERTEEGLVLATYADVMAGSVNGPVIVPGNAEDSYLVEQIVSGDMPKRAPRLLPAEIRFITDWVNSGAPDN